MSDATPKSIKPDAPRADGRTQSQLRPVTIQRQFTMHAPGSVLISQGNTRVICTACVEEKVPPHRLASGGGWVTAEYGMLPGSTNTRSSRSQGGREREIQRLIGRSLRAVVDLDALGPRTIVCDCDVLQADGGTRTASITGAWIALHDCFTHLRDRGLIERLPMKGQICAVSVGIVDDRALLDLDYSEDSRAEVDFNVVAVGDGRFVEVQGTAEGRPFSMEQLQAMLSLAQGGNRDLLAQQRTTLGLT